MRVRDGSAATTGVGVWVGSAVSGVAEATDVGLSVAVAVATGVRVAVQAAVGLGPTPGVLVGSDRSLRVGDGRGADRVGVRLGMGAGVSLGAAGRLVGVSTSTRIGVDVGRGV